MRYMAVLLASSSSNEVVTYPLDLMLISCDLCAWSKYLTVRKDNYADVKHAVQAPAFAQSSAPAAAAVAYDLAPAPASALPFTFLLCM